jgi:hypothetical protein
MKFLSVLFLVLVFAAPSFADNVTIVRDPDAQVRQLPGNATIVTNNGSGPSGVYIHGDDSIARTMLFGPRTRIYAPDYGSVNSACPPTLSVHDRNRCTRDLVKAQEKIRKKYND